MSETPQRSESPVGTISANAGATHLIIDGNFVDELIPIIQGAKFEIRLCAYAWRWYMTEPELAMQKFNVALLRKSMSGCKIKILVDNNSMKDTFKKLGFNVRAVEPTKMLHTKAICCDRDSLVIGSHNLTKRAGCDNYEMSLVTQEYEPIAQFCEYFDAMWSSRG